MILGKWKQIDREKWENRKENKWLGISFCSLRIYMHWLPWMLLLDRSVYLLWINLKSCTCWKKFVNCVKWLGLAGKNTSAKWPTAHFQLIHTSWENISVKMRCSLSDCFINLCSIYQFFHLFSNRVLEISRNDIDVWIKWNSKIFSIYSRRQTMCKYWKLNWYHICSCAIQIACYTLQKLFFFAFEIKHISNFLFERNQTGDWITWRKIFNVSTTAAAITVKFQAFNHSFSIHLRLIEISFIVIISQKWFLLACNGAIFTNGYDLHKSSINLRSYALLNINWCFHVSQFVTCQNKITTKKTFFTIDHWILFVEIIYKQLCSIAQWAFRNKLEIKIV